VRLLRKAARDEQVKAVVLRINSPGGSASAADVIEHEVRRLKEKKPVVASMGSVAASGGYWIATHAHEIWLQPNTITGSIGVFGLFFNLQKLAGDHGLNREVVRTAAHADFDSLLRPKTPDELARVRRLVDGIYEGFLQRVAEGRGLSLQKVAELAQGRVWSGRQALRLGLADHEGGLREAIAAAARRADLKTYGIVEYQRAESWVDVLLRQLGLAPEEGGDARGRQMRSLLRALRVLFDYTDPKGVYARLPYDLHIH
jgi:protease-4